MQERHKILITGSTGFVGQALSKLLENEGYDLLQSIRRPSQTKTINNSVYIGDLNSKNEWKHVLSDCKVVIHLAARAHKLNDKKLNPLEEFRRINAEATINLAKQAAKCGVNKFIFLSSIGVNGNLTNGKAFETTDMPSPHSPYALSKLEAETGLLKISRKSDMDVVIIRAPAIHGKNVPGNFGLIAKLINYNIPFPLGSINNKRSLVSIENIVSFIKQCIEHPNAANQILFVSDNKDYSTVEIIRLIGSYINKKPIIIKSPSIFLWLLLTILGKKKARDSLMSDLQLNSKKSQMLIDWSPSTSPE